MSGARLGASFWLCEYSTPFDYYSHGVKEVLAYRKTEFQEMMIVDSGAYGKALILDGIWQTCEGDEFLYHEPLVHAPCICHGSPEKVLILGGGDGGSLREVLKWKTVKKAVMVDIDREVVMACKELLPEIHRGSFDDPRAELVFNDALAVLDEYENEWDVIISDLTDPIETGPSFRLFTREYFAKCRRALTSRGVFIIQAGSASPVQVVMHARLTNTMKTVFDSVAHVVSHVPTYASVWGFGMGGNASIPHEFDTGRIDELLAEKTTGEFRWMDGRALVGLMNPPKYLRDAVAAETMVYTLEKPPEFYALRGHAQEK